MHNEWKDLTDAKPYIRETNFDLIASTLINQAKLEQVGRVVTKRTNAKPVADVESVCFASVEMGQIVCSNKLQHRAEILP